MKKIIIGTNIWTRRAKRKWTISFEVDDLAMWQKPPSIHTKTFFAKCNFQEYDHTKVYRSYKVVVHFFASRNQNKIGGWVKWKTLGICIFHFYNGLAYFEGFKLKIALPYPILFTLNLTNCKKSQSLPPFPKWLHCVSCN